MAEILREHRVLGPQLRHRRLKLAVNFALGQGDVALDPAFGCRWSQFFEGSTLQRVQSGLGLSHVTLTEGKVYCEFESPMAQLRP